MIHKKDSTIIIEFPMDNNIAAFLILKPTSYTPFRIATNKAFSRMWASVAS